MMSVFGSFPSVFIELLHKSSSTYSAAVKSFVFFNLELLFLRSNYIYWDTKLISLDDSRPTIDRSIVSSSQPPTAVGHVFTSWPWPKSPEQMRDSQNIPPNYQIKSPKSQHSMEKCLFHFQSIYMKCIPLQINSILSISLQHIIDIAIAIAISLPYFVPLNWIYLNTLLTICFFADYYNKKFFNYLPLFQQLYSKMFYYGNQNLLLILIDWNICSLLLGNTTKREQKRYFFNLFITLLEKSFRGLWNQIKLWITSSK